MPGQICADILRAVSQRWKAGRFNRLHQETTSSFDTTQHLQAFNIYCRVTNLVSQSLYHILKSFFFCFKAFPQNPMVAEPQKPGGCLESGGFSLEWQRDTEQLCPGPCGEQHPLPCRHLRGAPQLVLALNKGTKILMYTNIPQSGFCCSTHLANTLTNTSVS